MGNMSQNFRHDLDVNLQYWFEVSGLLFQVVVPVKLNYPPEEGKWSVAQVLEHLNGYCRYYLPAIEKATIYVSKDTNAWFVPGYWGNYFTNMIMPKNVYDIKNKMKTVKKFRPDRGANVE